MPIEVWASTDPASVANVMGSFVGQVVFDVGGNAGQSAKVFSRRFWRIVSFEPAIESYEILVQEAPGNCLPLNVAVSDRSGHVELTMYEAHMAQGQLATAGQSHWMDAEVGAWGKVLGTRVVPSVTLDLFTKTTGLVPDLIKVDVEGHEVHVIRGALGVIAEFKPRLYIEVHGKELGEELKHLLVPLYGGRLASWKHDHYAPESWEAETHYWLIVE